MNWCARTEVLSRRQDGGNQQCPPSHIQPGRSAAAAQGQVRRLACNPPCTDGWMGTSNHRPHAQRPERKCVLGQRPINGTNTTQTIMILELPEPRPCTNVRVLLLGAAWRSGRQVCLRPLEDGVRGVLTDNCFPHSACSGRAGQSAQANACHPVL